MHLLKQSTYFLWANTRDTSAHNSAFMQRYYIPSAADEPYTPFANRSAFIELDTYQLRVNSEKTLAYHSASIRQNLVLAVGESSLL